MGEAALTWSCDICTEKGLQSKRNCGCEKIEGVCKEHGTIEYDECEEDENTGKLLCIKCGKVVKVPFELRLGKRYRIYRCPVSEIDPVAITIIEIINWCEAMGSTPNGVAPMDESWKYFELRNFVTGEQNRARSELEIIKPQSNVADRSREQGSRSPKR